MAAADGIERKRGANLPHWTAEQATYSVTFRLADSLPAAAAARLQKQYAELERKAAGAALTLEEALRLSRARSAAAEAALNECAGECLMRRAEAADLVAKALQHFDGARYRLLAWCVMPNHVHAVLQPMGNHDLPGILHSWKSFTAHAINKLLGRSGPVWQTEYYDHLIRDEQDLIHHVAYVRENPVVAGLRDWKWVG